MAGSLVRKLERFGPLRDEERQVLEAVALDAWPAATGRDLVREGEQPLHCLLLLDGYACRYKRLRSGRRQIVAFLIPGDLCDLASLFLPQADHSVATLTPARIAAVPYATVLGWLTGEGALGRALWRDTLIEASVAREWVLNVGQRTPVQRVAHVLCELVARMRTVGLASGEEGACMLPVGPVELADATGMETVHVNRALGELRAGGLVELDSGILAARDWSGLAKVAEFDPRYLHQLAAAA